MIIKSILDEDLYKFTMMQAVLHQFPSTEVEYKFRCRNKGTDLSPLADKIASEIKDYCSLKFEKPDLDYLSSLRFMKKDFIEFLRVFRLNPDFVSVSVDKDAAPEDRLSIRIKGPWLHTIMFEVPILAIVNELASIPDRVELGMIEQFGRDATIKKCRFIKANPGMHVADFGTRRRFSRDWHEEIVASMSDSGAIIGTSNVWLAKKYNITPIGTMAHEWLQAGQAMSVRLADSQKFMLEAWVREYRGDLGYALTDVIGIDSFLKDFDLYFAKLYDGLRHDSGDPIEFGEKVVAHYKALRIDPMTKTAIFSDSLTVQRAKEILDRFKDRIKVSFGIGTHLTNDVGIKPLNCVIKMVACNGQPVAKLSDSPGKGMCEDDEFVRYLKHVFGRA